MRAKDAIIAVKERLSLVDVASRYLDLKRNGSRFVAPCPFHQETKPSFSINPEKGFFYCFGCHETGDVLTFYGKINGLDFRASLEQLAAEIGIEIDSWQDNPKDAAKAREKLTATRQMLRMHESAARHYAGCLGKASGATCREYIKKRDISPEIQERFGLGWAEDAWHSLLETLRAQGHDLNLACEAGLLGRSQSGNFYDRFRARLMFPIKNLSNQIIAFGGRIIAEADEAKYINSADSPIYKKGEHLYGLAQARRAITTKKLALLTEGYMDVLTLHQFGYDNGVGVLGTSLTGDQIRRLGGFTSRFILIFDGDRAGRKAALRACEMLLSRGLACAVVLLPDGEDIDSLLHGYGNKVFDDLLDKARDGLDYCIDALKSLAPREAVEWTRNFLANISVPELVSPYASALARRLGIAEESLRVGALHAQRTNSSRAVEEHGKLLNMRDVQIMIYAVRYPERLDELREMGADLALTSSRARQFWDLLEQWGGQEAVYHLDEKQKKFWFQQRGPGSPPLDNGDYELDCLRRELASFYINTQKNSLSTALAENRTAADFKTDLEYLRALQETLEKRDEQS